MNKGILIFIFFLLFLPDVYGQKNLSIPLLSPLYKKSVSEQSVSSPVDSGVYVVQLRGSSNSTNYHLLKTLPDGYAIIRWRSGVSKKSDFLEMSPANGLWKASDGLAVQWLRMQARTKMRLQLALQVPLSNTALPIDRQTQLLDTSHERYPVIQTTKKGLLAVLENSDVIFAQPVRSPVEELILPAVDQSISQVNRVRAHYPAINGSGIKVAVKENNYDGQDLDLLGRSFVAGPVAASTSTHATIMATLIGGKGNTSSNSLGVAPEVQLTSADFANLLPDDLRFLTGKGITVENHSYGVSMENYYGIEAVEYDRQIYIADTLVHVFSAGNAGTATPSDGFYAGVTNRANLTGTFKQAKNVLVVGGIDPFYLPEALSSKGPAYDGRVKPELVAAGQDGTSGAAATVTGVVALMQQWYRQQTGKALPSALSKAILINSADDVATPHVDFTTGYGKVNAFEALNTIAEKRYISDTLTAFGEKSFSIIIDQPMAELKVSIAWNDPAAAIHAPKSLLNDLDLQVVDEAGQVYLPWVLNSQPTRLDNTAIRGVDSLNNVEQVSLDSPGMGHYTIVVKGHRWQQSQAFALSYQTRKADIFEWTSPAAHEQWRAGTGQVIRWNQTKRPSIGRLKVSYDGGQNWQLLSDTIALQTGYYQWHTPNLFTQAQLRMEVGEQAYLSPVFSLSHPLSLRVGYVCPGESLLYWPSQPGSVGYQLYALQHDRLVKYASVPDTIIQFPTGPSSFQYFAIAALGKEGWESIRSSTINIQEQGVNCYVRSLLAELESDTVRGNSIPNRVRLSLYLGTSVGLQGITWQKRQGTSYVNLAHTDVRQGTTDYVTYDTSLQSGMLVYRALLSRQAGDSVTTEEASIIVLKADEFLVFPNPVQDQLQVLSGQIEEYELNLLDTFGRTVLKGQINNLEQQLSVAAIHPGLYLCQISRQGKPVFLTKLVKR